MLIEGIGPNVVQNSASNAAPVGVTNSTGSLDDWTGIPFNNANVAGAGTGNRPCAVSTNPDPSRGGDAWGSSTPNASTAMHAPTMSTIESTAPTSWKWICSSGTP